MNTSCALCVTPLTIMDTVLGENKLSDGGILCNKCLNKATAVNSDLVNSLINYSLIEIRDLVWSASIEETEEVVEEPVVETTTSRTTMTFSHTVQFTIDKPKPTRSDEIKEQIATLNSNLNASLGNQIRELEKILDQDERILAIEKGSYMQENNEGVLVATQRRMIFIYKRIFGNINKDEFVYHTITNVLYGSGDGTSLLKIYINTSSNVKANIVLDNKESAKLFYETIKNYINIPEKRVKQHSAHPVSLQKEDPSTVFDKLEKLGKLRENGILTEEEFTEQKKKLLNKL
ncbi:PH domain-containing protein [Chryseobacterium sp. c4a]|uniref:PH domain-containing protein n=1 Tax=Chryseobacterium sp. c4a TaxID=1573582 RepID=UPI001E4C14AE|nr:PH domain-containing protein [Chryseobacterium sp. c4a]